MKKNSLNILILIFFLLLIFHDPVICQLLYEDNLEVTIHKLSALNDTGELDRLIEETEQKIKGKTITGKEHFELGLLLFVKMLFDTAKGESLWMQAIHQVEKAISLSPEMAEAHAILGHLYMCPFIEDREIIKKSKACFEQALRLDPNQIVAKDGMRRIALRSAPVSEKEMNFKKLLGNLSRVTRSGRKFSVLTVKITDSLHGCDLIADLRIEDVSRNDIIDTIKIFKLMGGRSGIKPPPKSQKMVVSSIIRMVGEVQGATYSNYKTIDLDLDRIGINMNIIGEDSIGLIFTPVDMMKKYNTKKISQKEFFGSMEYMYKK